MNRLMLEIYADAPPDAPDNGPAALPGIFIAPWSGASIVDGAGAAPGGAVVLRLLGRGCLVEDPTSNEPSKPATLGEWLQAGGWRVRVTNAPLSLSGSAALPGTTGGAGEEPSWAAPEIRITTYEGDRPKHRRCMLPAVEGGQLVVGRGGPNTDLVIEDDHVSRRHMRFFVRDGQRMAEDLGSRWGTHLNGAPLTDPRPLKHGDEIRLGKSTIQYFCYYDMLPPSGVSVIDNVAKVNASVGNASAPDGLLGEGAPVSKAAPPPLPNQTPADPVPAEPEPAPVAPPDAEKPDDQKLPEEKPAPVKPKSPPPKPAPAKKAAKAPVKRNYWGFDVGGAIILALIVLAGIGYVVYLVLFKK